MKNLKSIILIILLTIVLSICTTCFATETRSTENTTTEETNTTSIVENDLYLYGNDITMNQNVDGNVYIFGKNVNISGEVYGNLFICAGNVTFEDSAYIDSSTYIVAKNVNFNAYSDSLYVACNELSIPENHGTYKDLYAITTKTTLLGTIGRNANIFTSQLIMSSDSSQGSITGNLNYSSDTQLELPDNAVTGEITYLANNTGKTYNTIWDIIINIVNSIFATSLVYLLYRFFLEKGLEKSSSCLSHKFGKVVLTGIVSLIAIPIISIILIIAKVGLIPGLLLLMLYMFMIGISPYIFASVLARRIYNNKKFSKMPLEYLLAILIGVVLSALQMIPFIGIIVTIFISIIGFGIIIYNLFFNENHKNSNIEENVAK